MLSGWSLLTFAAALSDFNPFIPNLLLSVDSFEHKIVSKAS